MTSLKDKIQLLKRSNLVLTTTYPLVKDTRDVRLLVGFSHLFYISLKLAIRIEGIYGRHVNN